MSDYYRFFEFVHFDFIFKISTSHFSLLTSLTYSHLTYSHLASHLTTHQIINGNSQRFFIGIIDLATLYSFSKDDFNRLKLKLMQVNVRENVTPISLLPFTNTNEDIPLEKVCEGCERRNEDVGLKEVG
jgi:hypothetical protein